MLPAVQEKFDSYPKPIKTHLMEVRALVMDIIHENNLSKCEEALKWGEPSYIVKGGSTVRLGWKPKHPGQCFVFFNCKTKLIDTFRELYSNTLEFQGNRAIVLSVNEPLPHRTLRHCIELSLTYKSIKHLPLLGV